MNARWCAAPIAVLLWACSSSDGSALAPASDAGEAGAAVPDAPPPCPTATAITVTGETTPGKVVTLGIASSAGGFDVAWTVSAGTLASPSGPTVAWTLPAGIATHVAETLKVTAKVTAPGCPPANLSLDVSVDWPEGLRTVVIYNPTQTGSKDVAAYYAAFRKIPLDHLCAAAATDPTSIASAEYKTFVGAVAACVAAVGPEVHTLVPVWGVPYKVSGQVHDLGTPANFAEVSLDALLVYGSASTSIAYATQNPLYQGTDGQGGSDSMSGKYKPYVPFGPWRAKATTDYFLVARIDGADATAAKALVDTTAQADQLAKAGQLAGVVYVDGRMGVPHPTTDAFGTYASGEWNMVGVENVFSAYKKYKVVADYNDAEFGTAPAPLTCPDALYYAGWYSFGHYNDAFTWKPGAIGAHLDSCSACDIRGQTDWSAMALRRGITATFGAVSEPYVSGLPEYDQFFLYLTQGASYGEAAYEATVYGGWMVVFVGDPLYRPYAK